ncbi:MAG TPA: MFS transporter [Bryobacteraceae bacterium]|nr:MFS transporter [Bryobacteraceae bacterium]
MRSSPLLPIFLIVAVDVLGLTIMIPLLPFYAEKLGANAFQVGWLIGLYAACQLISGPLLGRLSDHMGRKPLLLVSQFGTFIGFLVTAFAPNLWILFLARGIDGSTAGNLSLAQAYISDVTKPEDRAKSFGIIGIAFGMGFLIGPAISGFLAQYDYRDPIFAAAALSAISIFTTYRLLPTGKPHAAEASAAASAPAAPGGKRLSLVEWGAYVEYFHRPALAPRLWEFLSFAFGFAMFTSGLPLFAERRLTWHGAPFGPVQLGYIWAFAGFLGIFLQGPALGRLVKRFGEKSLLRTGFASYVVGYLMLALCHSLAVLLAATVVLALGGLVRPTLTSLITQATPRTEQGVVLGLTQSLSSVSQIVGPLLAGYMINLGTYNDLWLTGWGVIACVVSGVGLTLTSRSAAFAVAIDT